MPLISSIHIDNFRGLRDFRLEGARMFNLLVGPSEIGKTSVLEAINLMSSFGYGDKFLDINGLRGAVTENKTDAAASMASLFYNFSPLPITLEVVSTPQGASGEVRTKMKVEPAMEDEVVSYDNAPDMQVSADSSLMELGKFNGLKYTVEASGAVSGKGQGAVRLKDKSIAKEPFRMNLHQNEEDGGSAKDVFIWGCVFLRFPAPAERAMQIAAVNKKKDAVIEVLRMINPLVADFAMYDRPYIDIGLEKMVPLHISGDGLRQALSTLGFLCSKDYKVLLEDEIGAGIYFGAQEAFLRGVLRLAKKENRQIFATTHNKDMLIALKKVLAEEEDLRDDAAVFSFMRDKRDKVQATPYLYEDIDYCIANGKEIR